MVGCWVPAGGKEGEPGWSFAPPLSICQPWKSSEQPGLREHLTAPGTRGVGASISPLWSLSTSWHVAPPEGRFLSLALPLLPRLISSKCPRDGDCGCDSCCGTGHHLVTCSPGATKPPWRGPTV